MLKKFAIFLCSTIFAVGYCQENSGEEVVDVGDKSAEFRSTPLMVKLDGRPGLTIASPIADISFASTIMAIEPPWRTRRFYSEEFGKAAPIEKTDEGYVARLLQTNGTHEFVLNDYSCKVNGNTAIVTLDCEASADIPSVFEYSAFAIPYTLLNGATYNALLQDGTEVKGKITAAEPSVVALMHNNVVKITFKAQLGTLTFEVLEGDGFNVVDRRGVIFAGKKAFWLGYQGTLDFGKPFRSVISVKFEMADDLVIATPEKSDISTSLTNEKVKKGIVEFKPEMPLLPVPKKMIQPLPGTGKLFEADKMDELYAKIVGISDKEELDKLQRAAVRTFDKMGLELNSPPKGIKVYTSINIFIVPDSMENQEGYKLTIDDKAITITSPTPRGAFYAMQTLRGIYRNGKFAECSIEDWPDMPIRSAHLLVDDYSKIFHTNLVNDVLIPMKFNAIVPECEFVKWESTKELHQKWGMEKEDFINLVKLCEENYIDIIPLFQTFGHCGWMFPDGPDGKKMNLDMAEDPNYPYAYNVSHPELYPFIEKVLDEVMEACGNPEFLHIGHDEVFHPKAEFPHRPENKAKGASKLLYDDVMWFYNYGKKNDTKIMMWHDLLVTPEESPENGAGGEPMNFVSIRKKLPKDIYIVAWRYDGRNKDFPDITALRNEGFPVLGAPWHEPNNVENLTEFCSNNGAVGMLQTIWCGYNGNKIVTHNGFFQLVPYVRSGVWGWNANRSVNNYNPEQVFCDLIANWQPQTPGDVILIDIAPVANLKLNKENNPFLTRKTYGFDKLPVGKQQIGKVMFNLPERDGVPAAIALKSKLNPLFPEEIVLPLNIKANELYFLTTSIDIAPQKFATIADLTVVYGDGTSDGMPLQYTWQLAALDDNFNYYQNTGNVRSWIDGGKSYRNWFFTWKNQHPDKIIKEVKLKGTKDLLSFYLLGLSAR